MALEQFKRYARTSEEFELVKVDLSDIPSLYDWVKAHDERYEIESWGDPMRDYLVLDFIGEPFQEILLDDGDYLAWNESVNGIVVHSQQTFEELFAQ